MKTVFVALIFIFEANSGQPLEAGVAAFESEAQCEAAVASIRARAAQDMLITVEASCLETPLVAAAD